MKKLILTFGSIMALSMIQGCRGRESASNVKAGGSNYHQKWHSVTLTPNQAKTLWDLKQVPFEFLQIGHSARKSASWMGCSFVVYRVDAICNIKVKVQDVEDVEIDNASARVIHTLFNDAYTGIRAQLGLTSTTVQEIKNIILSYNQTSGVYSGSLDLDEIVIDNQYNDDTSDQSGQFPFYVSKDSVYYTSRPDATAIRIAYLPFGTHVQILERQTNSSGMRMILIVTEGGLQGWIKAEDITRRPPSNR